MDNSFSKQNDTVSYMPPAKYYWLLYQTLSGTSIGVCTTKHPFQYIHDTNILGSNKKHGRIKLLNWKEVQKSEYSLWVDLNPELALSDLSEVHQMD